MFPNGDWLKDDELARRAMPSGSRNHRKAARARARRYWARVRFHRAMPPAWLAAEGWGLASAAAWRPGGAVDPALPGGMLFWTTRMGGCERMAMDLDGTDHTKELLQLIRKTAHRWNPHEVFSDFVELSCLSFSNAVDRRQFDAREARYLQIAKRYPRDVFESFPRMLGHLTFAMEQRYAAGGLGDVLGVVYMQLELGNDRAGQFFTPYHVSQMMARMLVGDGAEVRAKGFLDVLEPASGAGGMVIAMADALQQAGLNYQGAMHATCIDIDLCCVHMTYLQASLLHIPAIVLHGNSLSNEVWSRWYTPAHVLGGWRRRIEARQAREPEPQRTDTVSPAVPHPARAHKSDARPERRPVVRQAPQPKVAAQLRLFDD